MGRRQSCPVCTRPRDASADAAAAELPDELRGNMILAGVYDMLPAAPCERCLNRAVDAYKRRGLGAAVQYLATAAVVPRVIKRGRTAIEQRRLGAGGRRKKRRRLAGGDE